MDKEGFPCGSAGKESACNAGDLGSIPGFGRCPGEGKATHSMESQSQTELSNFHFHFTGQGSYY